LEKLGINVTWLIAQIVNFGVLLFVLWQFAYKPVLGMLNSRKQKIQESLEYADKVKQDAAAQQKEFEKKLEATRRETQAAAAAAAQVGVKEREVIVAQAREEARKLIDQAREQIEYERKQMLSDLRQEVVRLSMLATHHVVSTSLDENAQRKLVTEFLAQADTLGKN
jgi:F-type H+-transporting ATPase subunit b